MDYTCKIDFQCSKVYIFVNNTHKNVQAEKSGEIADIHFGYILNKSTNLF